MEKKRFTPIVITSRKALKHIEKIKATHAELMQGMAMQAEKRRQYQEQKKIEAQQQAQMAQEQQRIRIEQEMKANSERMAHEKEMAAQKNKQAELEIKRMALAEK